MRKITILVAAATAISSTAVMAADLPRKAPVHPAASETVDWSGFYAGGHLGYVQARGQLTDPTAPGQSRTDTLKGFIGGGQLGYNLQRGAWVYGVEVDISGSNADGSTTIFDAIAGSTDQSKQSLRWTSLLTGRIGYAFDRSLVYAKGGFAFGGARLEARDLTANTFASANYTKTGWTVGGGVEYALTRSWSVRGEYDYVALGTKNLSLTDNTGTTQAVQVKLDAHQFKAGLNYRF